MQVSDLIGHPDQLDRETLYGLRELVARYPYYQAARLLLLKNLFLLHDESFGEELRRTAPCIADRSTLFALVEGHNYKIRDEAADTLSTENVTADPDRTQSLIDRFLQGNQAVQETSPKRKPTAIDATTNYVAFLMDMDDLETAETSTATESDAPAPARSKSRSSQLIDGFMEQQNERLQLQDEPEYTPDIPAEEQERANEEDYFTETLAKIYVKQERYEKAMEIIHKLYLNYPKKNRYFADQMRFLQKLIINNKHNKA